MSRRLDETAEFSVVSSDGTLITGEERGAGHAIVIVDGALCHRGFGPTRAIARELAARFRVISYDRRGRGGSGDTAPYSVDRELEDLGAIIAHAGGDASVLGLSSGGALAVQAAAAGVPMRALAVYEAPFVGIHTDEGRPRDYVAELESRLAKGDRGAAVRYFMLEIVEQPAFSTVIMRAIPGLWSSLTAVAPTLPYDSRIMDDYRVPASAAGRITVPSLVMGGSRAKPDMEAAVRELANAIPGAELRVLPKQTHQVKPTALAPAVTRFIDDAVLS